MSRLKLSIVVPAFSEEGSLRQLYEKIVESVKELNGDYEIIFIDDGGTDNSFRILKELHEEDPRVKVIQFRKNYGKAAALSVGFQKAEGDIIITMDADLQDDPAEIPNFVAEIEKGYDLVSGWKFRRKDALMRKIASKIFNRATSLLTGIKIHDFNCGFKAYRREVAEDIKVYGELHRYLPVLAHWAGYRIGEIKVRHHPRRHGRTKYGMSRYLHGFFDLVTVIFLTKYTRRPLHLFGTIGVALTLAGLVINAYLTIVKLKTGSIFPRYPLLLLGILLMILGIQFISTGLIGEMITSTHREIKEYSVRKRLG